MSCVLARPLLSWRNQGMAPVQEEVVLMPDMDALLLWWRPHVGAGLVVEQAGKDGPSLALPREFRGTNSYFPTHEYPGLYRTFAALEDTAEAALAFANEYGPLLIPAPPVNESGRRSEPLSFWRAARAWM